MTARPVPQPPATRRTVLGAGLGGTFAGGYASARSTTARAASTDTVAFRGVHQAGIVTPAQEHVHLADAPPADTGEVADLPPARLTLTFGFGATVFTTTDGRDRFGLTGRRPAALVELPHSAGDALEEARCGGDLVVQACAKITAEDPRALADHVWVPTTTDDPSGDWMVDGSCLVARRIRMQVETWDRTSLHMQEQVIGRSKRAGAPLAGGVEHTEPDLAATGRDGTPLVPVDSHVHLAHPSRDGGVRMLRRGYSYTDGSDGLGHLDAGLVFLAHVRDPRTHDIPMQTALARDDALSEYLRQTGSGLWAVPRGVPHVADLTGADGAFIGEGLLV